MINKLKHIWGVVGPIFFIGLGVYFLQKTNTLLGEIIGWTCIIFWSALLCILGYKLINNFQKQHNR